DRAARHHFAYFPGTALIAAAWRALPRPWDDYRIFVLLATFALLPAALLFPGALYVRLSVGAGLAANPILLKGAWFGTADAPALLALVLAFGLLARGRLVWAAARLGPALAALLLNRGAIDDRFGNYPFVWLALLFWLPLTAWLLWAQRRAGTLWAGAIGFSVSMFVLLFLSRVFQSSYLAWPLTGIGVALLLAEADGSRQPAPAESPSSAARE